MARSAILVEDNSGGLHMVVTDNGRCIEAVSNLERASPGHMLADMRAAVAEGMEAWADRAEDPQSLHDERTVVRPSGLQPDAGRGRPVERFRA